jgi:hypothetical protein
MAAKRLLGQPLPLGLRPSLGARVTCWRLDLQNRHPWLMAAGLRYGYHRAMLVELSANPDRRRRLLSRLLHPRAYLRYLRSLKLHLGRAG